MKLQIESRQAEIDFTKEQLANLRQRLDSVKVPENKDENEHLQSVEENQDDAVKQRVMPSESVAKTSNSKASVRREGF